MLHLELHVVSTPLPERLPSAGVVPVGPQVSMAVRRSLGSEANIRFCRLPLHQHVGFDLTAVCDGAAQFSAQNSQHQEVRIIRYLRRF